MMHIFLGTPSFGDSYHVFPMCVCRNHSNPKHSKDAVLLQALGRSSSSITAVVVVYFFFIPNSMSRCKKTRTLQTYSLACTSSRANVYPNHEMHCVISPADLSHHTTFSLFNITVWPPGAGSWEQGGGELGVGWGAVGASLTPAPPPILEPTPMTTFECDGDSVNW